MPKNVTITYIQVENQEDRNVTAYTTKRHIMTPTLRPVVILVEEPFGLELYEPIKVIQLFLLPCN